MCFSWSKSISYARGAPPPLAWHGLRCPSASSVYSRPPGETREPIPPVHRAVANAGSRPNHESAKDTKKTSVLSFVSSCFRGCISELQQVSRNVRDHLDAALG